MRIARVHAVTGATLADIFERMPLAHVLQFEAIYWQDFSYTDQTSALMALTAFMGGKTRTISVREIGTSQTQRLV